MCWRPLAIYRQFLHLGRSRCRLLSVTGISLCLSQDIYVGHNYTATLEDAIALATNAGTQIVFGGNVTRSRLAMQAAIADKKVAREKLQANVARALLTRFRCESKRARRRAGDQIATPLSIWFGGGCPLTTAAVCHVARRLGEFDGGGPHGAVDGIDLIPRLDSKAHRAIARRTAAESCVLLKNAKQTLPLVVAGAVRGPPYGCRTFAPVDAGIDTLDSLLTKLSRVGVLDHTGGPEEHRGGRAVHRRSGDPAALVQRPAVLHRDAARRGPTSVWWGEQQVFGRARRGGRPESGRRRWPAPVRRGGRQRQRGGGACSAGGADDRGARPGQPGGVRSGRPWGGARGLVRIRGSTPSPGLRLATALLSLL